MKLLAIVWVIFSTSIPFQGDKYELKLSGSGMESEQFRQMVDWITRARTARP